MASHTPSPAGLPSAAMRAGLSEHGIVLAGFFDF